MWMNALLYKNNTSLNKDMQRVNTIGMEKPTIYFTIVRSSASSALSDVPVKKTNF